MRSLTCTNATPHVAHFVLSLDTQVVARLPGISPGARLRVAVGRNFSVTAHATVGEHCYTSAPLLVSGTTTCLAQWQGGGRSDTAADRALVLQPQHSA